MDVLRPQIIRIDGRCYRKNTIIQKTVEEYEEEEMNTSSVAADEAYCDEVCDEFADNIEHTSSGFKSSLDIPSAYFKHIIGRNGDTKKRLENETRTLIRIPPRGQEGEIVITGHQCKGVISAKTRIDLLVSSAREREPFTHFLSIPIQADHVNERFTQFKDDVVRFCGEDRGIDATIFQNPHKLHMTIGVMPLLNTTEIERAKALLQQCQEEIVGPILQDGCISCQIQGLEYMNDDPGQVDVLYAQIQLHDGSDRLQMLADRLVDKFSMAGLMSRDYDRVKLHITIMNTLMRKDPGGAGVEISGGQNRSTRDRESFDANNILKLYRDYSFGPYLINTIHLSERYLTGSDGYYSCEDRLVL